jgi:hypothetical protein
MKRIFNGLYRLTLSLWVGGVVIFTFLVTPVLFNSFDREVAGGIVAKLFPLYFPYLLVLEAVALVAFIIGREESKALAATLPIYLLIGALGVSLFVNYKLYPDIREAKREAASSGRESEFARLHAVSAGLNLLILADGIALLLIGPALRRREEPLGAPEGAQAQPPVR